MAWNTMTETTYLEYLLGQIQESHPEVKAIYVSRHDDDEEALCLQVIVEGQDEYEDLFDYVVIGHGQEDLPAEIYDYARRELGEDFYDMTVTL